jgi:hypothetical protein
VLAQRRRCETAERAATRKGPGGGFSRGAEAKVWRAHQGSSAVVALCRVHGRLHRC